MASSPSAACGLDFGTSNSAIGRIEAGLPRLVEVEAGRDAIPTAVFFSFESGRVAYGRQAVALYLEREEGRLMRSLKSLLGSSLINDATTIRRQRVRFIEIISMFLRFMRAAAGAPEMVVMGRPVHFVDNNPEADRNAEDQLRAAAREAGFVDIEFQYEPIAAALDYERSIVAEQLAFVVDIGGGTSDFSVVRVSPERRGRPDRSGDILGYSGVRIGGTDFDRHLELREVMPHLGLGSKLAQKDMEPPVWFFHDLSTWSRINFLYDAKVIAEIRRVQREALEPEKLDRLLAVIEARRGHELLGAVEQAKIDLSEAASAELALARFAGLSSTVLTRLGLERAIGDAVDRVVSRLEGTLRQAGVAAGEIDAVFLTGGSSRLPLLQARVGAIFPEAAIISGDAFGSVATGLTLEAQSRFGA